MIFNFSGRWIRRAVPSSRFSNFIEVDGFRVAERHSETRRLPCWHRPAPLAHTFGASGTTCGTSAPGFEVLSSQTVPNAFSLIVLLVVQAHSAWCSARSRGSPPTEIRRRFVLSFPRPQDKHSIFRMQRDAPLNPCDSLLTEATPTHWPGSIKDPVPSKTTMLPLSIIPETASKGFRTSAPWRVTRLEMSFTTVSFGMDLC